MPFEVVFLEGRHSPPHGLQLFQFLDALLFALLSVATEKSCVAAYLSNLAASFPNPKPSTKNGGSVALNEDHMRCSQAQFSSTHKVLDI